MLRRRERAGYLWTALIAANLEFNIESSVPSSFDSLNGKKPLALSNLYKQAVRTFSGNCKRYHTFSSKSELRSAKEKGSFKGTRLVDTSTEVGVGISV